MLEPVPYPPPELIHLVAFRTAGLHVADTEAGLTEWTAAWLRFRECAECTQVMHFALAKERSEAKLDRPVIGKQVLDVAAGGGVVAGGAVGAKEQVHELVTHELVLYEEGENEVVVGAVGVAKAAGVHIRQMRAEGLETQEEAAGRVQPADESRPVDTDQPAVDVGAGKEIRLRSVAHKGIRRPRDF